MTKKTPGSPPPPLSAMAQKAELDAWRRSADAVRKGFEENARAVEKQLGLVPELLDRIDRWRQAQPTQPSRAAAIRYLVESRLDELEQEQPAD